MKLPAWSTKPPICPVAGDEEMVTTWWLVMLPLLFLIYIDTGNILLKHKILTWWQWQMGRVQFYVLPKKKAAHSCGPDGLHSFVHGKEGRYPQASSGGSYERSLDTAEIHGFISWTFAPSTSLGAFSIFQVPLVLHTY